MILDHRLPLVEERSPVGGNPLATKHTIPKLAPSPRTSQANVTQHLRRAILAGHLPPGTRLVQADLADSLQMSVTPIREALRQLSSEGLIDLDAFRGAVVHTPTLAELEEIFEIRAALMPLSVRKSIGYITSAQLQTAEALLDQMEAEPDQAEWIVLNREFHRLLYGPMTTSHLHNVLQRLSDIATLYINLSFTQHPDQRASADAEHRAILAAYLTQDVDQATHLVLTHINSTLESARMVLDPN
ncbi:MAG: GntR family transcriptional regulator [Leptolyngbya sp. DLM2.Bin15]|nr:MAG: GntR family transcriptional regulator [Leptolyngbya sp. DLM2.Bin15]